MTAQHYRERLTAPWWAHPAVVTFAIILGLESSFLAGGLLAQGVVVLVFAVAGELLVWRYGSRVVEVGGGHVRAGGWRLPIRQVRAVAVLDAAATRREMRRSDDQVYRCTRSWVPAALMLHVEDPDDLPLWLVSTRHPQELATALADAARADLAAATPGGSAAASPGGSAAASPGGSAAAAGSVTWTPSPEAH